MAIKVKERPLLHRTFACRAEKDASTFLKGEYLLLSSITYIEVVREIRDNEQQYIQTIHNLELFGDHIKSNTKTFMIDHVHDISYKSSSNQLGVLYLHTNQGLFSFQINMCPDHFIKEYRKLI